MDNHGVSERRSVRWAGCFLFLLTISMLMTTIQAHAAGIKRSPGSPLGSSIPVVMIDAGHGGIDGGASHGDILEKHITLDLARRLYGLLEAGGYLAVLNRDGDYALSDDNRWLNSRSRHTRDLAQRKELAETLKAGLVVSVHVNWSPSASSRGPLVLYRSKEGRSYLLARSIQEQLNAIYGTRAVPKAGKPFYLLNQTSGAAVIVEAGFISSPADRALLCSPAGRQKLAEAVADGVATYLMGV